MIDSRTPAVPAPSDPPKATEKPPAEPPARNSYAEWLNEEPSTTRASERTLASPTPVLGKQTVRATLTVLSGASAGRVVPIVDGITVLGRSRDAQVRFDDAGVSRNHARIALAGVGRYRLEDLESTNGTFVSGNRVQQAELESGDRILLGPHVTLTFSMVDSAAVRVANELYESSVRDTLTHAHNRRYLIERLGSELAYARRHGTALSLVMFDLDHFKRINDEHGHLAGDAVLREVAALVGRMIRLEDVFARFGGEEFVVLARGVEHAGAGKFAERVRTAVERLEVMAEGARIRFTVSVGYAAVSELPAATRGAEALLRLADERLYKAKEAGRNRSAGR